MVTRLVAELLGELNLNVREIHSRKPQSYRTRVSEEFRKSKGLILVTSDVSARGVDYPDVTLVIQVIHTEHWVITHLYGVLCCSACNTHSKYYSDNCSYHPLQTIITGILECFMDYIFYVLTFYHENQ